jgi:cathepsin L
MFKITASIALLMAAAVSGHVHDRAYYEEKFFNWMKQHKVKAVNGMHFVQMLKNFADNEDYINAHNSRGSSYRLAHNAFSHMDQVEWSAYVKKGLLNMPSTKGSKVHGAPSDLSSVPTSIDWEPKGAVTPVKDQGQCGSCWSFSTTGALEGALQIKGGDLISLSEQNLVDCDNRKGNPKGSDMGCNGGLMDNAFDWTGKNGGLCTEADYPYTSGTTKTAGTCSDSSCSKVAASAPSSHTDVKQKSDSAMMDALAQQPVSIAIEADQKDFQLYSSGVFTGSCGTNLDHGVLAVGYGSQNGEDYYRVKNSWGTTWGDKGYILLGRGSQYNNGAGQCGMLMSASYPNL